VRRRWVVAGIAAALATFGVLGGGSAVAPAARATDRAVGLCGSLAGQRPHVTKVLWIFMENESYGHGPGQIPGSSSDPYLRRTLIGQCGSTSDYHAITHPSYPNYLAATSGRTHGVVAGGLRYFRGQNIFGQVDPSWRSYQQFMPVNCDHVAQTGSREADHYYVGRHNPAASYASLPVGAPKAGDCRRYDESLGTTKAGPLVQDVRTGKLPRFGFITPGLCDDMHLLPPGVPGCPNPIAAGDAWLARWIPIITAGPDYADGRLVIDITWDEGSGGTLGARCLTSAARNCIVPDIVISPYTRHVVSATDFSHYSLLKMTERLLRVPYLGAAAKAGTKNLCRPFGLCP
jgi:phosphatidylinositol-3-phosphatase